MYYSIDICSKWSEILIPFRRLYIWYISTLANYEISAINNFRYVFFYSFLGICLPKNLLDLFPMRNLSRTYVSQDIQDQDLMDINLLTAKQQFLNDSLTNEGGDESSVISSISDVSSVSKRSKWMGAKHGRSNCLYCCRLRKLHRSQNQSRLEGSGNDSSTTTLCEMYTNASAALVAAGIQATVALARKGTGGGGGVVNSSTTSGGTSSKPPLQQQPQFSNASSIQLSELQFNSPESILSEESMPDKLTANILYNVQRLANPVSAKQSKLALLELKQKHPTSFQDICLYSEVCRTLGRSCYRMNARRFLQELFLDLDFDSFYNEPLEILSKKNKDSFQKVESKERVVGADKLSLLKERMKRDLNPPGGSRTDIALSDSKTDSLLSTATASNNVVAIGPQTLKPHLKSQPLASVYEASCENLLFDPSPRPHTSIIATKSLISKQNCSNFTVAPPPPAPPPLPEYNTELRITSDDDDDDDDDELSRNNYCRSSQRQNQQNCDEVDSSVRMSSSIFSLNPTASSNATQPMQSAAASSSHNNYLNSVCSVSTPISSSNCSDQTTTSNQSSVCTISHHPLNNSNRLNSTPLTSPPPILKPIENENTKFRRGRFYTLELDLSCSKNKFPITDRTRSSMINYVKAAEKITATLSPSPSITTTSRSSTAIAGSLLRQHSLGSDSTPNYRLPVTRLSYTDGVTPTTQHLQPPTATQATSNNHKFLITKSLAASLAQPIGTLYCEKRLQSSKSEAILTQTPTITTVNSGSIISALNLNKGASDVCGGAGGAVTCSTVNNTATISSSS